MNLYFHPMKNTKIVITDGEKGKVLGVISCYRVHKCVAVSFPGLFCAAANIGKGSTLFPTAAAAKQAIRARLKEIA